MVCKNARPIGAPFRLLRHCRWRPIRARRFVA